MFNYITWAAMATSWNKLTAIVIPFSALARWFPAPNVAEFGKPLKFSTFTIIYIRKYVHAYNLHNSNSFNLTVPVLFQYVCLFIHRGAGLRHNLVPTFFFFAKLCNPYDLEYLMRVNKNLMAEAGVRVCLPATLTKEFFFFINTR